MVICLQKDGLCTIPPLLVRLNVSATNHTPRCVQYRKLMEKGFIVQPSSANPFDRIPVEQAIEESNGCKVDLIGFSGGHMTYLENQSKFLESMQQFLKMWKYHYKAIFSIIVNNCVDKKHCFHVKKT